MHQNVININNFLSMLVNELNLQEVSLYITRKIQNSNVCYSNYSVERARFCFDNRSFVCKTTAGNGESEGVKMCS